MASRILRAPPGAIGFQASNDALVYIVLWLEVAAAMVPLVAYLRTEDKSVAVASPAPKGPLDRFRVGGAYLFAALVLAFTYTHADEPGVAVTGLRSPSSVTLFGVANALSAVAFAIMCDAEAKASSPESNWLILYWWLQVCAWATAGTVRLDPNASDGLADPLGGAAFAFWGLSLVVLSLWVAYACLAAQARFLTKATDNLPPECYAGPASVGFFSWMSPLVKLGWERPLVQEDLAHLHPSDNPTHLNRLFQVAWGAQLAKAEATGGQPSLLRALISAYGYDYFVGCLIKFLYDISQFVGPFLLQKTIAFLSARQAAETGDDDEEVPSMRVGYELVALMFTNAVVQSLLLHQYFHRAFRTGMRLKSAIVASIYDKSLRVKPGAAAAAVPARKKPPTLVELVFGKKTAPSAKSADKPAAAALSSGVKVANLPVTLPGKAPILAGAGAGSSKGPKLVQQGLTKAQFEALSASGAANEGKVKEVELAELASLKTQPAEPLDPAAANKAAAAKAEAAKAGKRKTTGEIVNLMAVDAQRLQDSMAMLAVLWSGIFQIVLALWYLFSIMGISVLAGLVIMLVSIPLTSKISIMSRNLQKDVMTIKDDRIKVENEVLGGMKIIKLYAWEEPFKKKVDAIRNDELAQLWKYKRFQIVQRVTFSVVPTLVSVCTFALYTALGNKLTAATAFTALALFNILRFPLFMLPNSISSCVEATLSLDRVKSFLMASEVKQLPSLLGAAPSASGGALVSLSSGVSAQDDWWAVGRPLPQARPETMAAESAERRNKNRLKRAAKKAAANGGAVNPLTAATGGESSPRKSPRLKPASGEASPRARAASGGRKRGDSKSSQRGGSAASASELDLLDSDSDDGVDPFVRDDGERKAAAESAGFDPEGNDDESKTDPLTLRASDGLDSGPMAGKPREPFVRRGALRVELRGACLEWDNGTELLSDASFSVRDGELVMCVGATGSGKSGLLAAIIGELEPVGGKVSSRGSIAYVSQVAWIQNASLKDNVLFGKAFDAKRYNAIIDACALSADLAQLPAGDLTEIGEKGINLSGGQKQRVAIARAVYADADIYLLDDCLSAVDAQVAHHIFTRCLRHPKLLLRKAVLLVSHNLQLLPHADTVVLLCDKEVAFVGTHAAFLELDNDLARQAKGHATKGFGRQSSSGGGGSMQLYLDPKAKEAKAEAAAKLEGLEEAEAEAKAKAEAKKKAEVKVKALIEVEKLERGSVAFSTYWKYITASGTLTMVFGVIGGQILFNLSQGATNWWLGYWADHSAASDGTAVAEGEVVRGSEGIGVYSALSLGTIAITVGASYASNWASHSSSKKFHEELVAGVVRAPMAFFDATPLGRIMNRFSKDISTLDDRLPMTVYMWLSTLCTVVVAIAIISYVVPWFMVACVPMGLLYRRVMTLFVPTARELQRLEGVTRSPIFSHFGETLEGASTIRAFRAEGQFFAGAMDKLEKNLRSYYANVSSNRWLALRLEAIGTCFVTFAALLAVQGAGKVSGGNGGLALSYSLSITQTLNWYVRQSAELESQIVSVERLQEYSSPLIPQEAAPLVEGRRPRPGWPHAGAIDFKGVAMRYRPGLPLVLKGDDAGNGLACSIKGGQRVGIVGRTGAGKSSLLLVLLRLVEPDSNGGSLVIDGEDVLTMGLDDLRGSISIIPQDPVLFTGTVRFNVDPFSKHDDAAVWSALKRAHLGPHLASLPSGLEAEVEEGGRNFSMGERQLLCLARALLRASRILLLDEATSAVDHVTDGLVQATIASEFKGCTVLTIAHRLDTIRDYDRVIVLSDGKVVEDDAPGNLVDDAKYPSGQFNAMWKAHQQGDLS